MDKKIDSKVDKIILEIRPGVGGIEAASFMKDLGFMYYNFFNKNNYKIDFFSEYDNIVIISASGEGLYKLFCNEGGVHRVQRVPKTEKQGRIHTSTASVFVNKKSDKTKTKIKLEDVDFKSTRSSGPGGQSVNKTESKIVATYKFNGQTFTVAMQDEKSQYANKQKAFEILQNLVDINESKTEEKENNDNRLNQIGQASRSEKIRTYNFNDNRVTDHRIMKSFFNLEKILSGDILNILTSCQILNN